MFAIPTEIWFPVVTLVLGVLLKGFLDTLADRRATRRDRDARLEQQRISIMLKRAEFQHETLLELQERLMRLVQITAQTHHEDAAAFCTTKIWQRQPLGPQLNEDARQNMADLSKLRVRISNDDIREGVQTLKETCVNVAFSQDRETARAHLQDSMALLGALQEKIGAQLRKLDDAEDVLIAAPDQ